MLQIKHISKEYRTGELVQTALNDVSLNFRDNEFVSILGPSGSGKTTLLNIVGGLDRYDSGDLIINDISTKNYKDRDWDSYRNHTIGFVFQSYNLIPHQTILANVELALTISGISKKERRQRALDALEEVGLREQAHKKPNQMSGGQMQRVAIARALVNNPDILLADEPTGALDTETSVQVMNLLQKVANDRLVIMVTHNPELAEEYSTRIVKLKDGKIIGDTDPFIPEEEVLAPPVYKNMGKSTMSLLTALSLSFNNLLTKKGRTILTAFAGSIGIIGIALILSLSTGFQNYIDKIQEDTLTSYPLTVTAETADTMSALLAMAEQSGDNDGTDVVKERQYFATMFSQIGTNDLKSFKKHLEKDKDTVDEMVSMIRYQYAVTPLIYTEDKDDNIVQLNPSTLMSAMRGNSMQAASNVLATTSGTAVFNEMIDDKETLKEQYEVLAGRWPKKKDEVILVLPEPNGMPDILVYSLGLRDGKELDNMIADLMAGKSVKNENKPLKFTYKELMKIPMKVIDASATYKYNESYNVYENMTEDEAFMKNAYKNGMDLKIVGIVSAKEGESATSLSPGIAYTKELTEYVIKTASKSEIVKKQLKDDEVDVFSNKRFDSEEEGAGLDFQDMISVDTNMLSEAFGTKIDEDDITDMTKGYTEEISDAITADTSDAEEDFQSTLVTLMNGMLNGYIEENANPAMGGAALIKKSQVETLISNYMAKEESQTLLAELETDYIIPKDTFSTMYTQLIKGGLEAYIAMAPMDANATEDPTSALTTETVATFVSQFVEQDTFVSMKEEFGRTMTEAVMKKTVLTKVGELAGELMGTMADAFDVDESKIAGAFSFDMSEETLMRLYETMSASGVEKNAIMNLTTLGYQDVEEPSNIAFYFKDFESKEAFIDYLDKYNEKMEEVDEEKVIKYTDLTGILMSSVKTIVDSVSYVLISFVSISLVVSSIMIGIITYISVLERTKEIGVLRAIGASKRNISSIFNAETFIVGLFSGVLGIGVTLLALYPINHVIHSVTGNTNIIAVLPKEGGTILVILSVILTLIGGLIPSKQAAKKDPVAALRSE